jgi:hypothetical protein
MMSPTRFSDGSDPRFIATILETTDVTYLPLAPLAKLAVFG